MPRRILTGLLILCFPAASALGAVESAVPAPVERDAASGYGAASGDGALLVRAGGGGGRSSSSRSSSSRSSSSRSYSSGRSYYGGGGGHMDVNPVVILLVLGVGALVVFLIYRAIKNASVLGDMRAAMPEGKPRGDWDGFLANNPDFNEEQFKEKVRKAFVDIQAGWQAQDVSKERKFLSDGVYQRFNTQFKMMGLLKQKNTIADLDVKGVAIDKVESDGLYDILHVAVMARIDDHFVCELDSSLNSGGKETFVEYWTFLKKRGKPTKDIYDTQTCPNCGGALPEKMGEITKCEYCGSMTNSGEFDWVLSEITQADDYAAVNPKLAKSENLTEKLAELVGENEDFSVQLLEDKASNGYLQILTAQAVKDPSVMRRFVTNELFDKLEKEMGDRQVVFNRIYLNDVTVLGARDDGKKNVVAVAIKASMQRVELADGRLARKIDEAVIAKNRVILLTRDKGVGANKGSLYAHSCPNCGAPIENTLDIKCVYCSAVLNSTKTEWIISAVMSVDEYATYYAQYAADFTYRVDPTMLDKVMDARDFALNNLMIIIAADGVFSKEEEEFAKAAARKWGFNVNQLAPMFQMAQAGRLVIRMPEDPKARKRIYVLLKEAAAVDGTVDPAEKRILDSIKENFLKQPEGGDDGKQQGGEGGREGAA